MKVLITGGGGYIGTVLTKALLDKGAHVICLDRLFFGYEKIQPFLAHPNYQILRDDIRTFDKNILKGIDVVIDLAALSSDPLSYLVEDKTFEINHQGRLRVCRLAKEMGVQRYILSSSCSVYGFNPSECHEESTPNPVSIYAKANLKAEEVLKEANDKFCVTVLRLATAFGISQRMRFDLAVNLMTLKAFKEGEIDVLGQGIQWRPFIHVKDVAKVFLGVMNAPEKQINGQIFNVGENKYNLKIINLAYLIRELLPFKIQIKIAPDDPDRRSYRVNFDKLHAHLGLTMDISIEDGVREIYSALKDGDVWDYPDTYTVRWYKYLLEAGSLIENVYLDGKLL